MAHACLPGNGRLYPGNWYSDGHFGCDVVSPAFADRRTGRTDRWRRVDRLDGGGQFHDRLRFQMGLACDGLGVGLQSRTLWVGSVAELGSAFTAMRNLVLSALASSDDVEVVERKGAGHPDTICDALAETLSRNLCREYQSRFGRILHHNVDKALLCGGRAMPAFGGGSLIAPINVYLAGRAIAEVGNDVIPIEELAIE